MNRQQRRALARKARKAGMSKDKAEAFARIASGTGEHTHRQEILDGDKVRLNVEAIMSRKNYDVMSDKYKEFVENANESVFTAHVEQEVLVSLVEEPKWLFWCGDLIRVKSNNEQDS